MSMIEEGHDQMVRMAHLAIVASYSVNGVAALHSDLLKQGLFTDFYELWPEKFNNKTNGVTQRRWLAACNPGLGKLITSKIGDGWVTDLERLQELEPHCEQPSFQERLLGIKRQHKQTLAKIVAGLAAFGASAIAVGAVAGDDVVCNDCSAGVEYDNAIVASCHHIGCDDEVAVDGADTGTEIGDRETAHE